MSRIRTAAVAAATCSILIAASAGVANAKTITLHLFSKQVYSSFRGPNGEALPPNAPPTVGDRFAFANDDYLGNHKHHAKRPFASEHIDCVINSPTTAKCDGALALGGAMLFADNWTLDLTSQSPPSVIKLTGGTNQFRHARGTIRVKPVGGPNSNNSDNTVRFRP
jgi:hypothetical protein